MSYQAHTPAEWASFLSLGVSAYSAMSVPYFLFVDAVLRDFDPRPAVRRALESGRLVPLWQGAVHTGHDANRALAAGQRAAALALRDAAVSLTALLMLLTARPEATR